jgi:beta-galactoside alpha-2,6-sialyltransferase (sialyltransferase 1)
VVSKPEFNFLTSKIFQNIHLAAWDPGKYNGTLESWIRAPDYDIFHNYQLFMSKYPKANFHLVDPISIWRLWEQLQDFTGTPIIKNPPSSGFIGKYIDDRLWCYLPATSHTCHSISGLALLLPVCEYIDFIEYIPSTRLKEICHYYDDDQNPGCTFGSWHPLAAEKLMVYSMNTIDDFSVFQNGIVRIRKTENDFCGK